MSDYDEQFDENLIDNNNNIDDDQSYNNNECTTSYVNWNSPLSDCIFEDPDNMILFSEAMKHHNLWHDALIYNICIESNINFFRFMFYNDEEFTNKFNVSLLFKSIELNNDEAINLLLEKYPDIIYKTEVRGDYITTNILHYLANSDYLDLFKTIAAKNPKALYQKDNTEYNSYPLNYIIKNKSDDSLSIEIVKECIEYDNYDPNYGDMLINLSCQYPNFDFQLYILEKINTNEDHVNKMLIILMQYDSRSNYKIIEILLRDYGADPNKYYDDIDYDISSVKIACQHESYEILLLLEKYGGNLNNSELLLHCGEHYDCKIIKYLVDNYNLNLDIYNENEGCTYPILIFSDYSDLDNYDICEYIIDHDIDFTAVNFEGDSFLHLWTRRTTINGHQSDNNKMKMIFKLIERGADPYHINNDGDYFFNYEHSFIDDRLLFSYDEYKELHDYGIDLTLPNGNDENLLDILCNFYDGDEEYSEEYNKLYELFADICGMVRSD